MFKKITRQQLEKFLSKYASSKKVLDIGSGGSSYERFFPNRLTIDIDSARNPEIIADAHNLPFKNEEFELILCTEVLEHLKDPQKAINEMHRVLKKDGRVILTTRFVFPLHDAPHDYWRFTKYGLRELFREWNIIELVEETPTFSAIAVLLQRIGYQTTLRWNKVSKFFVFLVAFLFSRMNFLIVKEYGDIKKSSSEHGLLSSGYYIVAEK